MLKVLTILLIAFAIIIAILLIKYKPAYKVTIGKIELGYIQDKKEFIEKLEIALGENKEENIAFAELSKKPQIEFQLVNQTIQTSEDEVLEKIEEEAEPVYTMYTIAVNGEEKANVASEEEADSVIESLQTEYEEKVEVDLEIKQTYLKEKPEILSKEVAVASLKEGTMEALLKAKQEDTKKEKVIVAVRPVTGGTITSRYGVRSSIRSGAHTGLDIAKPTGTPIKVCNSGTVTFAGYKGSYGYLVIVSHGNGVETWYGHCSKLYVKKGESVSAGKTIAAVGSTGNSTGPHLHFEIRIGGKTVNPQKYL